MQEPANNKNESIRGNNSHVSISITTPYPVGPTQNIIVPEFKYIAGERPSPVFIRQMSCNVLPNDEKKQSGGRYDWLKLFLETQNSPYVDTPAYIGPIAASGSKLGGRGIIATRNMKCGELLICSKPIASIFPSIPSPGNVDNGLNLRPSSHNSQATILSHVIAKASGDFCQYNLVCSLYGGPTYPCYPDYPHNILKEGDAINIDPVLVERICSYNCFSPDPLTFGGQDYPAYMDGEVTPAALYGLASMFNHQCFSNAWWYCLGEVIIIRATRPILRGEEITIPYTGGESYQARCKSLWNHLSSPCQCNLCKLDESDGDEMLQKRDELLDSMINMFSQRSQPPPLDNAQRIVHDILATYASSRENINGLKLHAGRAYHLLAQMILRVPEDSSKFIKSIEAEILSLRCYGVSVSVGDLSQPGDGHLPLTVLDALPASEHGYTAFVMQFLCIAAAFKACGNTTQAHRWLKGAQWIEEKSMGADIEFFMARYGTFMKCAGIYELAKANEKTLRV